MTLEDHFEIHQKQRRDTESLSDLDSARWQAQQAFLERLREMRDSATWLAQDMEALARRIDEQGAEVELPSSSQALSLSSRVDLACAELVGLRQSLRTLDQLIATDG